MNEYENMEHRTSHTKRDACKRFAPITNCVANLHPVVRLACYAMRNFYGNSFQLFANTGLTESNGERRRYVFFGDGIYI